MIEQRSPQRSSACPARGELEQYRTGRLGEDREAQIEHHLETCEDCLRMVEAPDEVTDPLFEVLAGFPCTDEDEPEFKALYRQLLTRPPEFDAEPDQDEDLTQTASADFEYTRPQGLGSYPERLGVYRLEMCIGKGAHGAVFKARHEKLDRTVAIKILRSPKTDRDLAVERFLGEMRAVGRLDHRNIIRATDADEADGFHFLVMEYVPGLDAGRLARLTRQMPIADACEIARQAALALEFANQHHLVHRDVKPSNLLVTWNGVVKLLDLGLVANRHPDSSESEATSMPHGTADYMSPEQWTQYDAVDIRADLYSLGCTLFRLLCGRPPYHSVGNDLLHKRRAHLSGSIPSVRRSRSEVPLRLAELVERLLAKDPADRYQTPGQLAEALLPWCAGADLAQLVIGAGVEPPGPLVGGEQSGQRTSTAWPLSHVSRRTWIRLGLVGIPAAIWGGSQLRVRLQRAPEPPTGTWQELNTAIREPRVAVSSPAQILPVADGRPGALLVCDGLCLWELGAAVRGRFQLRTRLRPLQPGSVGGIYLQYRQGKDVDAVDAMRHSLVALEWYPGGLSLGATPESIPPSEEGERPPEMGFRWLRYELRERDSKWKIYQQVWSQCNLATTAGEHELTVRCGEVGIPEVLWDGQSQFAARWTVTPLGRLMTQTREERLPDMFRGSLGVFVARGQMEFVRPEFSYDA